MRYVDTDAASADNKGDIWRTDCKADLMASEIQVGLEQFYDR